MKEVGEGFTFILKFVRFEWLKAVAVVSFTFLG